MLNDNDYVPDTIEGLRQWLQVVSSACSDQRLLNYQFEVIYRRPLAPSSLSRVEIRIQGVLRRGALAYGVVVQ